MTANQPAGAEIGRRHIFQMDRAELQKLHQLLWARQKKTSSSSGELSARSLRIRATEWLLLNGLSTLHRFGRELTDEALAEDKAPETAKEWEIPAGSDECNTCRQYRVGKAIPIYEELATMRKEVGQIEANELQSKKQNGLNSMPTMNGCSNAGNSANYRCQLLNNQEEHNGGNQFGNNSHGSSGSALFGCLCCRRP